LYRTGVVIGKFYPPHAGHQLVIETALASCDTVHVIVCARPEQDPGGETRATWLSEMCPKARVQVVEDIYPSDDSEVWARKTVEWLGGAPDAVFTSEEYGERYARLMGSAHVSVDPRRERAPCSGTAVRSDPVKYWGFLAPCVRAHYAIRICAVGAESTGTTTLTQSLADHYHTEWVPEYGREYSERCKFRDGAVWTSDEFVHIARRQCELEDGAARRCSGLLFCDTDPLATAIWHERYMGHRSPEVERIAAKRDYALYLLTSPDIPFVQDGYRDGEHLRDWMHNRFREELANRGRRFAVIEGGHEQRLITATQLVDGVVGVAGRSEPG
jgi:HTH-type transcriptional regulator, transcriptional repressor of NAD biosynthesis genes